MENLAHTLAGFALARAGLARNRLETALLVAGSNLPDVDLLWSMRTRAAYLDEHRGITHSLTGGAALGVIFAAVLWAGAAASAFRSRRGPGSGVGDSFSNEPGSGTVSPFPPAFTRLSSLAVVAVFLHLAFDALNDYGVRPFLPFDGRWMYGDLVFIIDPWFWMLLGGSLHLSLPRPGDAAESRVRLRRRLGEAAAWTGWALLSLPVMLVAPVPGLARGAWVAGLVGLAALRFVPHGSRAGASAAAARPAGASSRTPQRRAGHPAPRAGLAAIALYVFVLGLVHVAALGRAREAFAASPAPPDPAARIAVLPTPANPLRWRAYRASADGILAGTLQLMDPVPRLREVARADRGLDAPEVLAALGTPEGAAARRFSRFLFAEVDRDGAGAPALVRLRDARFSMRGGGDSWSTIVVAVPRR